MKALTIRWIHIDLEGKKLSYEDKKSITSWSIEQEDGIVLLAQIAMLLGVFNPKGLEEKIRLFSHRRRTKEERR